MSKKRSAPQNSVVRLAERVGRRVMRGLGQQPAQPDPALAEIRQIYAMKARFLTPVSQPLLLVSQVQRSGGTLMSQLFDNHPELYAHAHELEIGFPKKYFYPDLDLNGDPIHWFNRLSEKSTRKLFFEGYHKHPDSAVYDKEDVFPFYLLPDLQRAIFVREAGRSRPTSMRDVFNLYFTSYFNAWLDYQGWGPAKRYVAAFTPRLATEPGNAGKFFHDFPDGRLIHVIRDPKGWYASSHRKSPHVYPDPQAAVPVWSRSGQAMLDNKALYGDRVRLVSFDTLLNDTRGVMTGIAAWAGLTWDETLVEPTFQGQPIKANTAFSTTQYGVIDEPRKRGSQVKEEDAAYIEAHAGELYRRVLELCE
jgi:hypothetical protein